MTFKTLYALCVLIGLGSVLVAFSLADAAFERECRLNQETTGCWAGRAGE